MGGQGMDFANHLKGFVQMEAGRLLRVPRRMLVRSPGKQPGLAADSFCSHYRGGGDENKMATKNLGYH